MDTVWNLRLQAAAAPQRVAIVCGAQRLSYAELEGLANRFAAVFRQLGLVRGDHIATLLGNRPEGLAVAWGAWRSGLYLTPMSTALAAPELRYLVQDCDARAVIGDAAFGELLSALPGRTANYARPATSAAQAMPATSATQATPATSVRCIGCRCTAPWLASRRSNRSSPTPRRCPRPMSRRAP